jgi:hypothetical protein
MWFRRQKQVDDLRVHVRGLVFSDFYHFPITVSQFYHYYIVDWLMIFPVEIEDFEGV